MSNKALKLLPLLFGALLLLAAALEAGNPLLVDTSGRLVGWQSFPIQVIYDQGTLGNLSNSDAVSLSQQIFTKWQSVATASLTFNAFQNPPSMISQDITTSNFNTFRSCTAGSELVGKFAVIFDTDGSITDQVFGSGQKDTVLGFAGPRCLGTNTQTGALSVNAATATLNGYVLTKTNPVSQDDFKAVIMHEVGHALGLDHTQLNGNLRSSSNSTDRAAVPLMFPFLTRNRPDPMGLALDDNTEISTIYPGATFPTQPALTGTVLLADGQTPFQGANVIARLVNDPNTTSTANVSGTRFTSSQQGFGSSDLQFKGKYEFFGLPAGNYTISVESIESRFNNGSSVGPLDPPFPLPYLTANFGPVALSTGSTTTQNLQLGQNQALPALANLTIIPHFAAGGGYVTRVFVRNVSTSSNNVIVQYMNQNGTVARNEPQTALTPGQTVSYTSGESNRTATLTVQWIAIGSDQALSASVLFDCCDAVTTTTAAGILPQTPGTSFSAPFVYQRQSSSQPVLEMGMGIANRSDQSNTITVKLFDQSNTLVSTDVLATLAGFGQTAFTVSQLTNLNNYLTGKTNVLGSLQVTGTQLFAPVIVGNLGGRLFSLPLTSP